MTLVEGVCSECGKTIQRSSPVPMVVTCDCYKECPSCEADMEPYMPDLNPSTYDSIESDIAQGDTANPLNILFYCPTCRYYSALKPVEVRLT